MKNKSLIPEFRMKRFQKPWQIACVLYFLLLLLIVILEEMMQSYFPTRTFSLIDLSSSLIGIILFYYLAELWIFYYKKRSRE